MSLPFLLLLDSGESLPNKAQALKLLPEGDDGA